ncbi:hypothetical protein NPIL_81791, partial [Nephila pilipes]
MAWPKFDVTADTVMTMTLNNQPIFNDVKTVTLMTNRPAVLAMMQPVTNP